MPVTKSEKIRSALRVVKQDLLDAIRLTDASCSGDRVPLNILENMYLRASALLHQLEAGDWTGRVVEKRSGQEPVDSTNDRWNARGPGRTGHQRLLRIPENPPRRTR